MNEIPANSDKKFNKVKLIFPFKYDLGGDIINLKKAEEKLKEAYPDLKTDKRALENFNLSYLSIKEPVLTLSDQEINLVLNGKEHLFNQMIKLYPDQGVLSIVLSVGLENISAFELIDFYNLFFKEKQREYIPYLKQHGCDTKALARFIKEETRVPQLKFGQIVDELRKPLKLFLKPRPSTYYFQDYRTLFLVLDDFSEQEVQQRSGELYMLLRLTKALNQPVSSVKALIDQSRLTYENKLILGGDWASVFLLNGDVKFEEDAIMLFDLSHTFWYICQTWIFVLNYILSEELPIIDKSIPIGEVDQKTYGDMVDAVLRLHDYLVSVHQTLIEVRNVDLMFKNPEFCKIMKNFYRSIRIPEHLGLVERNLSILDSRYQRASDSMTHKIDFATERQSSKVAFGMQILSLIFAGAIGLSIAELLQDAGIVSGWPALGVGMILWMLIACINAKVIRVIFKKARER